MKRPSTISVSVRLSASDRASLLSEAEKQNINISELLRRSWRAYQSSSQMQSQLLTMEQRLTHKICEILFSGLNLNESERETCKQELNSRGVKW